MFLARTDIQGPVIVGGLGGSGTRAFAAVLQKLGVEIGFDLNQALDNLTYTLLFKNAKLFDRALDWLNSPENVAAKLCFFRKTMLGQKRLNLMQWLSAVRSLNQAKRVGHNRAEGVRPQWTAQRWHALMTGHSFSAPYWGFKEPNSHIYLPALLQAYPGMTYFHVIRHGLDMACSSNTWQLQNWGPAFGIYPSQYQTDSAAAFAYWGAANSRVSQLREQYPEQVFFIKHEQLCQKPHETIHWLAAKAKLSIDDSQVESAAKLVKCPDPIHRYSQHDLSHIVNPAALLAKFGYDC